MRPTASCGTTAPRRDCSRRARRVEFHRAIVVNTLSKRSNMTAYRSGYIAGDPDLIRVLKNVRPRMGVATPEFVQRAAIAAWGDEAHVEAQRARYAERRALFLDLFRRKGITVEASEAAFYLWVRVPRGGARTRLGGLGGAAGAARGGRPPRRLLRPPGPGVHPAGRGA